MINILKILNGVRIINNNNKVLLLGLGKQGKAALYDISNSEEVSEIIVGDNSPKTKEFIDSLSTNKVRWERMDVSNEKEVIEKMKKVDVVIELLPPEFAFPTVKLAAEVGVDLVSSMYFNNPGETDEEKIKKRKEDLEKIDSIAKDKNITLLSEFGMDPGLDLIILNKTISDLDEVHELYSYGAGFPEYKAANNPLKYKFTWSVEGLLKSYLRPAKILKDENIVDIAADEMFEKENTHELDLDEFDGILECFANGNALEYAEDLGIENNLKSMGRFICRWEGHRGFWEPMAKSGFLNEEEIEVDDKKVSPLKFVASLLKNQEKFWYDEDERDIAFIRVDARGIKNGEKVRNLYQLIDKRDLETGFTAMTRTVGFTASIGAQLILKDELEKHGVLTPLDVPFSLISDEIKQRGMQVTHNSYSYDE